MKLKTKKSLVEYVIPRTFHENASVLYVEAGYSYEPPLWGVITAEIESMHALAPDKYVYMQLSVAKTAVSYLDTTKSLIASFSATDNK